ncbi:MAG: VIT family protein [Gammaproteobacteria bacterium]|nr:VIT family protein [Gammaproteobacteria bacterium]
MRKGHFERHYRERMGWLRAAVMGANDGIVSTASLVAGVAAAQADKPAVLLAATAGLVAGAMSMAAGEFVSVSSQRDSEQADLARERHELEHDAQAELEELTLIYQGRGLERELARQVADQMTRHDALGAHARDELGLHELQQAQPFQAAWASALTFAMGAGFPLLLAWLLPLRHLSWTVSAGSLLVLAGLGALAARTGGAGYFVGMRRVTFWGAAAMAATAAVGYLFGVAA